MSTRNQFARSFNMTLARQKERAERDLFGADGVPAETDEAKPGSYSEVRDGGEANISAPPKSAKEQFADWFNGKYPNAFNDR